MQERPIVALVGRPNVGKSTLFNRLLGRRDAITAHEAGTTRDRHFGVMYWFGHAWTLIDTAGVLMEDDESTLTPKALQSAMEEQVNLALDEATIIALIVDVKEDITRQDERLITELRKHDKPLVVLANKADNALARMEAQSFSQLGAMPLFPVSAIHGTGISDFIDYLIEHFPSPDHPTTESSLPRITFIGRPNVGKSMLLNRILNKERAVVSEIPGTTRDTIEEEVTLPSGERFLLVDTAGIRRSGKIGQGIERFSLVRTLKAINQSDIVVLVLTIEEVPTRGDAHVAAYALEANKELILVLNKTDLARDAVLNFSEHKQHNLGQRFLRRFPFLQRRPYYFISAKSGGGMDRFLKALASHLSEQKSVEKE